MGNSNQIERKQLNSNQNQQQLYQYVGEFKHSFSQIEMCRIMKFNSTSSLLFSGSENKIKMYAFCKGFVKKICELYHSNQALSYLNCKKDTILISGCVAMITIRSLIGMNNQKVQRKIKAIDNNFFSCFAISEKNNLLVAGLQDYIQFWEENHSCVFQLNLELVIGNDWVLSLSFNKSQNKLIACNGNYSIAIIQQQSNQIQQWKIAQIIDMDDFAIQAIFFGEDSFVIHPWKSRTMLVYKYNQESDVFTLSNTFLMQGEGQNSYSFYSLYIKYRYLKSNQSQNQNTLQRQLFIKQDKNELCLFLVNKNEELQIFQKVRFQDIQICGTMSDDGLWLIKWEEASKKLKVISYFKN